LRISESKIAEVAAAADIVQVISQYVDLKKAGRDFRGLCPFHGDKDPSFYVSPHKGIFHCFGCAVGGSVFNFLMRMEGVSFVEAVQTLAQRYGVDLPQNFTGGRGTGRSEKERFLKTIEAAHDYFRKHLDAHPPVTDYLENRGIARSWFETIGFGFAPDVWDGMQAHLGRSGLDVRDGVSLGLIKPRQTGGHYDYFRSRVMIPIRDINGNTVAFGGRIYGEGDPKYLNSPENALFRKRGVLYGLDSAKEAIKSEGFAILVEGYFDQISLRVRGVENVVAPLGTALGTEQVRLLRRFTSEVITIFDGDEAGLRAARRAIPLFITEGMEPRCLILTEDKDPDEAINRIGADAFRKMVHQAGSMIDFLLDNLQDRYDLSTLNGRNLALEECIPVVREIADSKEGDYLIERFSSRLRIREDRIRQALRSRSGAAKKPAQANVGKRMSLFDFPAHERNVVRGMLLLEGFIDRVMESGVLKDLEDPVLRSVAEQMVAYYQEIGSFESAAFCSSLEDPEIASLVAGWLKPRSEEDDLRPEVDGDRAIHDSVDVMRQRKLERRKNEIQERMRQGPDGAEDYNRLASELWEIARLLHR
jgi:DNA primase